MGESVLVQLFPGKGKNITTDSFFTSLKLATTSQAEKTSLVGTLRKCSCPPLQKSTWSCSTKRLCSCDSCHLPGRAQAECVDPELHAHKRGHHRCDEGNAGVSDVLKQH